MTSDIFVWNLSAKKHEDAIGRFIQELRGAYKTKTPFPVSLIADLLPIQLNQYNELRGRGDLEVEDDMFSNTSDDDLWIELYDPSIEDYFVTLPKVWTGKISDEDSLSIQFDNPLEVEIPRLTELGVNRTAYQLLYSMEASATDSISKFYDSSDEAKETWVHVSLTNSDDTASLEQFNLLDLGGNDAARSLTYSAVSRTKRDSNGCASKDVDDPSWKVLQDQSGVCFTHYGDLTLTAKLRYRVLAGPGKKQMIDEYMSKNCPDMFCEIKPR